jgi:hypothetical protein
MAFDEFPNWTLEREFRMALACVHRVPQNPGSPVMPTDPFYNDPKLGWLLVYRQL